MGLLDWIRRPGRTGAVAPQPASAPVLSPDGAPFLRAGERGSGSASSSAGFGRAGGGLSTAQLVTLASASLGYVNEQTKPWEVPWTLIHAMGFDPWIYLGERLFAAPLQDPGLYFVAHPDPAVVAETEAWLARALPGILRAITSAFAYGPAPYVLDWQVADLAIKVKGSSGQERNRNLPGHVHFGEHVHDLAPWEVELEVLGDRLQAIRYGRTVYRSDRAFCPVWDQRFGDWRGNGSRRRAWRAYFRGELTAAREDAWEERGVDPPRIGYAPKGTLTIDGEEVPATTLLTDAIMALKGGDAAVLPGDLDPERGERLWSIQAMQLPDVSSVWSAKLDRTAAEKLLASLVPPSSAGVGDASFSAARIPNEMFVELIESAASWVAEQVEQVTDQVYRVNLASRHKGADPPEINAREIPKAKVKRLMDVIRTVATVARSLPDGREVTLAELVDESILDEAGIPRRPTEDAARDPRKPEPGTPGRPREPLGARDERRDNAREPEGEDAVGDDGEQVDP